MILYCRLFEDDQIGSDYKGLNFLKIQNNISDLSDEEAIAEIAKLGYVEVILPDHPNDGFQYRQSAPQLVDNTYRGDWVRVYESETLKSLEKLKIFARKRRDQLLIESDWTQLADVPLSAERKQDWETYRQALRDITSQQRFPWDIMWPTPPL